MDDKITEILNIKIKRIEIIRLKRKRLRKVIIDFDNLKQH